MAYIAPVRWALIQTLFIGLMAFVKAVDPSEHAATPSLVTWVTKQPRPGNAHCIDQYGNEIKHGEEYVSPEDPCKTCHCQDDSIMCVSVQCSPPACVFEQVPGECCKFTCVDGTDVKLIPTDKDADKTNIGIRMIATAITSLLIFALLVFMIHRLRQRHLLISSRRMNVERQNDDDFVAYMTNIDQVDIGFEFPSYEDPPPPYTPRKPSDDGFQSDESPPPYQAGNMQTDGIGSANLIPQGHDPDVSNRGNPTQTRMSDNSHLTVVHSYSTTTDEARGKRSTGSSVERSSNRRGRGLRIPDGMLHYAGMESDIKKSREQQRKNAVHESYGNVLRDKANSGQSVFILKNGQSSGGQSKCHAVKSSNDSASSGRQSGSSSDKQQYRRRKMKYSENIVPTDSSASMQNNSNHANDYDCCILETGMYHSLEMSHVWPVDSLGVCALKRNAFPTDSTRLIFSSDTNNENQRGTNKDITDTVDCGSDVVILSNPGDVLICSPAEIICHYPAEISHHYPQGRINIRCHSRNTLKDDCLADDGFVVGRVLKVAELPLVCVKDLQKKAEIEITSIDIKVNDVSSGLVNSNDDVSGGDLVDLPSNESVTKVHHRGSEVYMKRVSYSGLSPSCQTVDTVTSPSLIINAEVEGKRLVCESPDEQEQTIESMGENSHRYSTSQTYFKDESSRISYVNDEQTFESNVANKFNKLATELSVHEINLKDDKRTDWVTEPIPLSASENGELSRHSFVEYDDKKILLGVLNRMNCLYNPETAEFNENVVHPAPEVFSRGTNLSLSNKLLDNLNFGTLNAHVASRVKMCNQSNFPFVPGMAVCN